MSNPLDKVPAGVDRGLSRWLSQVRDAITSLQNPQAAGGKIVGAQRNITIPAPMLLSVVRTYKSQSTIPPADQSDQSNQPIVCDLTFSEAPFTIQIARGITTTLPDSATIVGTTNSLYFEDSKSPGSDAAYFVRYISTPWGNTAWTGPFPITVDSAPDGAVVAGTPPDVNDAVGWEPNTAYDDNTLIVTPAPNSYTQVVTNAGTSGATAPVWNNTPGGTTTDGTITWTNAGYITYMQILSSHTLANVAFNYRGVWSSATAYVAGDEVVYGQSYWLCVAPNTNSAPATNNANWVVIGSYAAFEGVWNSTTNYAVGAEVIYGGAFWIALVANLNSPPSVSNTNWQMAGITGSNASFNVTAAGWYEVALSDNSEYADYRCAFNADVSVVNGGTQGTCSFKVTNDSTGAKGALTLVHGANGIAITQARVRIDGLNHTALDVYVNWTSGTLNVAVTVNPVQGAWNSAAAQAGLAATAGTVEQTLNMDPSGTGTNPGGTGHIGPGNKWHLFLDSGDFWHGAAHIGNGAGPGLDGVLNGTTYGRPLNTALTSGQVDLSQPGVIGKTLAYVADDLAGTGRSAHVVGLLANLPAAGTAGRTYLATNAGTQGILYRDTGTAWVEAGVGHLADINGTTDNLTPGTATDVVNQSNLTGGNVDLGKSGGVAGKNTDNISPGTGTGATTQAVTGAPRNLVPDSGIKSQTVYWPTMVNLGVINGFHQAGTSGGNAFEYVGTGAAAVATYAESSIIPVEPGVTYAFRAFINAQNVTAGSPYWLLESPDRATNYLVISQTAGQAGVLTGTWTAPAGVTEVAVEANANGCTVTSGAYAHWCDPKLEVGNVSTAYNENVASDSAGSLLIDAGNSGHIRQWAHPYMSAGVQAAITSAGAVAVVCSALNNTEQGTAYDGVAVTFSVAYPAGSTPIVIYLPGGLTYSSALTGSQQQIFQVTALTNNGFTPSLKLQQLATATNDSVNFTPYNTKTTSASAALAVPSGDVIINGAMTVNFSVYVPADSTDPVTLTVAGTQEWSKSLVTGGSAKTFSFSIPVTNTAAVNGSTVVVADTLGGVEATDVTYQVGTSPTQTSATPSGVSGVPFIVLPPQM